MYVQGFECVACSRMLPAEFDGYVCPDCGNNLLVRYDIGRIRTDLGDTPFRGERRDIFRYMALLPFGDIGNAPPLRVGATPLYHARRLGEEIGFPRLYLKDDTVNPSASFKDRASAVVLARAREKGVTVIAGASTGNAGSSMACLAASTGTPCVIFVPQHAPPAKIAQLLTFGARVLAVRGSYDDAFDLCLRVSEKRQWLNRNTGYNPFTREGKKTCAFEIFEQLGNRVPDWIVVPVGDGNIISGVAKGFDELLNLGLADKRPRLVCAQSRKSDALTRAFHSLRPSVESAGGGPDWSSVQIAPVKAATVADSISVDMPRDGLAALRALFTSGGAAVSVPDEAILDAIPQIARAAGVFVEPAAAVTWAALRELAAESVIKAGETVVLLLTGNGLKDIESARRTAGNPIVIDPTLEAAEKALGDM